jgi:prepilin-type N-terminal cleavage/methylation domain-containing protein
MRTPLTPRPRQRAGLTLIELMIGLVLLGIVGGALVKLLMIQGRFADSQEAYRNSRSVTRDAYNVMMTDLRMVQDTLAIQAANRDSIMVRVPYVYGIICAHSSGTTTASMVPVDSALYAMAAYGGVAWDSAGVFQFRPASGSPPSPPSYSDPTICLDSSATGAKVDSIVFRDSASGRVRGGRTMSLNPTLPNAKTGDPVFLWQEITYAFGSSVAYPGMRGLYRSVTNGPRDEIIAPFDTSAKFKFYVLNNDTSQVAAPANLNQIKGLDLLLNARSPTIPAGSKEPKLSKTRTAVYFKDRRDP